MGSKLELMDPKAVQKTGVFLSRTRILLLAAVAAMVLAAVAVGLYFAGKNSRGRPEPAEKWQHCERLAQQRGCKLLRSGQNQSHVAIF